MKIMVIKISKSKIIDLERSDVISQLSVVRDRITQLKKKYDMSFNQFKEEFDKSKEEDFERYDDLLIWEGYLESESYLEQRLEELKNAKDIIITE